MKNARSRGLGLGLLASVLVSGLAPSAWGDDSLEQRVSAEPEAHASFEAFADAWLVQLAADAREERDRNRLTVRVSAANKGHSYRTIPGDYEIQIKKTERPTTPYVGVLRYLEERYECRRSPAEICKRVESSQITEIFPFKDGSWHY